MKSFLVKFIKPELKKLIKNKEAELLYKANKDGLNKELCGINAKTSIKLLLWFQQILAQ